MLYGTLQLRRVKKLFSLLVRKNTSYTTESLTVRDACVHKKWALQVPRNSMEFHRTARVSEIGTLKVPWNSMERTARVNEIGALLVPWNPMELLVSAKLAHFKFHGIPWNCACQLNWRTWSSMESHGVPWNCSCHRNWRTFCSMEFHGHGTARVIEIGALQVPWNSMELLVTVPGHSMEPNVCYLMEPLVLSMHWVLNWDRIPRNLSFQILMKIILCRMN